jgi:hypothetical protein
MPFFSPFAPTYQRKFHFASEEHYHNGVIVFNID